MSAASLARLVRYPVKGFGGQELSSVTLARGLGLPHDRAVAVSNGTVAVDPAGGWTRCQAFVRLTKNTDLPLFEVAVDDATGETLRPELRMTGPDGDGLRVMIDNEASLRSADATLARWFVSGPLGPPRLVKADQGLWDHQDAMLSIINLETTRQLEEIADRSVDPLRFRGNLYLSGMPAGQELAWIGRRIRVGEAVLEVLRPIDRCRATSVDPRDASTDFNVPALIAAHHGHLFCGVYARVVTGGTVSLGQPIIDVGPAEHAVRDGATVDTAPPVGEWPRLAIVTRRVEESADVTSFWLTDPVAGLRTPPLPGQHLRVHAADSTGPFWRSYTISGVDGELLRITVKHAAVDARMGRLLREAAVEGSRLTISGPFGDVTVSASSGRDVESLLLVSAGIGLTPTLAVLRALVADGSRRPVAVFHVARDGSDLALWPEALELIDRLPGARVELFLTRPDAPAAVGDVLVRSARTGRPGPPDVARIARDLDPDRMSAYLCGPIAFMRSVREALLELGTAPERIHTEVFVSPNAGAGKTTPPPLPGPFEITFTASDATVPWTANSGTLLDVAEAAGLTLPAGCRAGACGSCAQPLAAGIVAYTSEPVLTLPPPGVLLCCAVPTSDVEIQA